MDGFDVNSEAEQARLLALHRFAEAGGCVSGVTHDVNNLLGAAMAYAELVTYDEGVSEDSKKMLGNIVDGITKCSGLISALTSISRKGRDNVELVAPEQLMDEVLMLRDYELKIRQISIELDYQQGIAAIPADAAKLKLERSRLIANAQEADGGASEKATRVGIGNVEGGVFFSVWDSGPGLSSEHMNAAFEPFTSFWPEGKEHVGLGLFSARKIVERHDGSLSYTAEEGFRLVVKRENELSRSL